jgi:hypothetical protein
VCATRDSLQPAQWLPAGLVHIPGELFTETVDKSGSSDFRQAEVRCCRRPVVVRAGVAAVHFRDGAIPPARGVCPEPTAGARSRRNRRPGSDDVRTVRVQRQRRGAGVARQEIRVEHARAAPGRWLAQAAWRDRAGASTLEAGGPAESGLGPGSASGRRRSCRAGRRAPAGPAYGSEGRRVWRRLGESPWPLAGGDAQPACPAFGHPMAPAATPTADASIGVTNIRRTGAHLESQSGGPVGRQHVAPACVHESCAGRVPTLGVTAEQAVKRSGHRVVLASLE